MNSLIRPHHMCTLQLKMNFKMRLHIFLLYLTVTEASRSFTIVLDTTLSMQEEIDVIKVNLGSTLAGFSNTTEVDNYVLIPFKDQDIGPPTHFSTPEDLMTSLNHITVSGGNDCPEDALAGIKTALEVSSQESYIFLFTDAYAKDDSKLAEIQNLCHTSRSQVLIFLSGRCRPNGREGGNVDVYYDVAESCSGGIFKLDPSNLKQAFKLIKEVTQVEWSDITTYESFTNYKELEIPIDSSTTDLMISVYGKYPKLQIVDENGSSPKIDKIVDSRHCLVVRINEFRGSNNRVSIGCRGRTSLTIYRLNDFPFKYGFTIRKPNNLKETTLRPIPGWTNYLMVVLPKDSAIRLNSIGLIKTESNEIKNLTFEESTAKVYVTKAFFEPNKLFKILFSGEDTSNSKMIQGSTKIFQTQKSVKDPSWTNPAVEIIEHTSTVNYGESITLACKVTGYPQPTISWKDQNDSNLYAEDILLEMPYVHISYVTINNMKDNVTVSCNAINSKGEDTKSIDIYVHREPVFEVKQSPTDTSVQYSSEGKLYCEAEAYPEATIAWYHNDTLIPADTSGNVEIRPEDHVLIIKNMNIDDTGAYKCEIKNEIETKEFTAHVEILGLEPPAIEVYNTDITMKPGDWTEIECIIKGIPKPEVTWKFKYNNVEELGSIPDGVYFDEGKLKIPTVKMDYVGLYRCEAFNILGVDYRDITVSVKYEPVIRTMEDTLTVREGDQVNLLCDVDAMPPARVRWEMYQDNVMVALDYRHVIYENNSHSFEALWKDSGFYRCIAENDVGRAEKSIKLNVLVPPYIQAPPSSSVIAKIGSSVTLSCNVLFGNPVPSTKWSFIGPNSSATILLRGNSTIELRLPNLSKENEGSYVCMADNEVGSDNIRISVKVQ